MSGEEQARPNSSTGLGESMSLTTPSPASTDAGTSSSAPATAPTSTSSTPTCATTAPLSTTDAASPSKPSMSAVTDNVTAAATPDLHGTNQPANSPKTTDVAQNTEAAVSCGTSCTPTSTSQATASSTAADAAAAHTASTSSDPTGAHNTVTATITWEQVQATRAGFGLEAAVTVFVYDKYTEQLGKADQHDEAVKVLQAAVKDAMTSLPVDHDSTIKLSMSLARHLHKSGQHQAAARHCKWLQQRVPAVFGQQSEEQLTLYGLQLDALFHRGALAEAWPVAQKAFDLCVHLYSLDHPATVTAACDCVKFSASQSQPVPPAALECVRQGLRQHAKPWDKGTISLATLLCMGCENSGQPQTAQKLLPEVLAATKDLHGEASKEYRDLLKLRAVNAAKCGKPAQALSIFQSLHHINTCTLGETHRDTLKSALELGDAHATVGRTADAAQIFKTLLPTVKVVLPVHDKLHMDLLCSYWSCLHRLGREREAQALMDDAVRSGLDPFTMMQWAEKIPPWQRGQ